MDSQVSRLKEIVNNKTKIISITSGKGGVGKSNFVANVALAISSLGKSVLIFDADLSLGNVDVLYGVRPKYNLNHYLNGEKTFEEILVEGPKNVKIVPASSGVQEMSNLNDNDKNRLLYKLKRMKSQYDVILIDTASGMGNNVMSFLLASPNIMVITTSDPTAITDAYAMIKIVSKENPNSNLKIVVNMVDDEKDAKEVVNKLNTVAQKFLNYPVKFGGYVLNDDKLKKAVKNQRPVYLKYPNASSVRCFKDIARRMVEEKVGKKDKSKWNFFEKALKLLGAK